MAGATVSDSFHLAEILVGITKVSNYDVSLHLAYRPAEGIATISLYFLCCNRCERSEADGERKVDSFFSPRFPFRGRRAENFFLCTATSCVLSSLSLVSFILSKPGHLSTSSYSKEAGHSSPTFAIIIRRRSPSAHTPRDTDSYLAPGDKDTK